MIKPIIAVAVAALGAAVLVATPILTLNVEASPTKAAQKGDRLPIAAVACPERAWPYFDAACARSPAAKTRPVRIISTDRLEQAPAVSGRS
jgi:hypothetical protein